MCQQKGCALDNYEAVTHRQWNFLHDLIMLLVSQACLLILLILLNTSKLILNYHWCSHSITICKLKSFNMWVCISELKKKDLQYGELETILPVPVQIRSICYLLRCVSVSLYITKTKYALSNKISTIYS